MATPRAPRARRGGSALTALVTALTVLLVVAATSAVSFFVSGRGGEVSASFLHAQPGSLKWDERSRFTLLFIVTGSESGQTSARSDFMAVCSYDPLSRSGALLSIPGDLWATIPGYGQGTISTAYADGGTRLALLTAESATGLVIPYYAVTGHAGFRALVDAVGGVTVRTDPSLSGMRVGSVTVSRHWQPMDGATALAYTRLSGAAGGPIARMQHMRAVLLGLENRMLAPGNMIRAPALVGELSGSFETNVPYSQAPDLMRALAGVPHARLHATDLDYGDRAVSNYQAGGAPVLLPDWQRIRAIAQGLIPYHSYGIPVRVLNGNGVDGQASVVAAWLRQAGVAVRGVGSAPSFQYARTQVMVQPHARWDALATARAVASLLQAPIVTGALARPASPVVLVVGGDYQDVNQQ